MTHEDRMTAAQKRHAKRQAQAALQRQISQMVNLDEFAAMCNISERTLRRYRATRPPNFPTAYGITARPTFKRADVLKWIDSKPMW